MGQGLKRLSIRLTRNCKTLSFLICLKNMTFWEMAPFSLSGGGKFFRWKWQLSPSSGLKRRRKVRNMVTDYTVFYIHGSVLRKSNLVTVQQDANYSVLHFCRQLYMFRVLTPIIRSWYSCNYSYWYRLTAINIYNYNYILVLVVAYFIHCIQSIPEAVITVVPAPDNGCQLPKHIELLTEM